MHCSGEPRRVTSSWKKANKKDTKATVCDHVSSADIRYSTPDAKGIKHLHGPYILFNKEEGALAWEEF